MNIKSVLYEIGNEYCIVVDVIVSDEYDTRYF